MLEPPAPPNMTPDMPPSSAESPPQGVKAKRSIKDRWIHLSTKWNPSSAESPPQEVKAKRSTKDRWIHLSTKWKALVIGTGIVILIIIIVAAAVYGLTVSSGNTRKTKTYMKAADAAYSTLNNDLTKLQSSLTTALAQGLGGNYSNIGATIWLYNNDVERNKALKQLQRITALYKKVDNLKGVADYKAYADAMQTVILTNAQLLNQGKSLLETLLTIASNPAAVRDFFNTKTMVITLLQNASNTVTKAEDNAQKIKEDKKLSW